MSGTRMWASFLLASGVGCGAEPEPPIRGMFLEGRAPVTPPAPLPFRARVVQPEAGAEFRPSEKLAYRIEVAGVPERANLPMASIHIRRGTRIYNSVAASNPELQGEVYVYSGTIDAPEQLGQFDLVAKLVQPLSYVDVSSNQLTDHSSRAESKPCAIRVVRGGRK